jgi:hypothetical protein
MNHLYAACDVTLGIGLGEGWGLTQAESMASGTPVIHGNYAGGAEFLPPKYLVEPVGWRYEGPACLKRPVFRAKDWADAVQKNQGDVPAVPDYIKWENAWIEWRKWLLEEEK